MSKHLIYSAPGRTEISGNHTDHQHGCVLAAAVDLETVATVELNGSNKIHINSLGYPEFSVSLDDLSVRESEKNTTAALVRGVAAAFAQRGAKLAGFDAVIQSSVLPGSGLSSSAAIIFAPERRNMNNRVQAAIGLLAPLNFSTPFQTMF